MRRRLTKRDERRISREVTFGSVVSVGLRAKNEVVVVETCRHAFCFS